MIQYFKQDKEFVKWCRDVSVTAQDIIKYVGKLRAGEDVWDNLYDTINKFDKLVDKPPIQKLKEPHEN